MHYLAWSVDPEEAITRLNSLHCTTWEELLKEQSATEETF